MTFQFFADAVLITHVAIVVFVVAGLLFVVFGNAVKWRWVNSLWFRLLHLASIGVVVVQSWFGVVCPLTTLEMWLREKAGEQTYQGSFVEHWLQQLLYYDAPPWVFTTAYTLFGLLVIASWWYWPPYIHRKKS